MTTWKTFFDSLPASWHESLDTYVQGIVDYCDKYKLKPTELFDEAEHRTLDEDSPIDDIDDIEEIQFLIGWITCAAELVDITPERLIAHVLVDGPKLRAVDGGKS